MSQHFRFLGSTRPSSRRALAGIGMLAGAATLAGCNLDSNVTPTGPQGVVQFINAAPRYNLVNLAVDDTLLVSGEPYGNGSTLGVNALSTPRNFIVTAGSDTTTLASAQLQIADQNIYTMVVTQRTTGAGLILLPDTVSAPPTGDVSVQVVNTSPTAGAVDVYVTGLDSTLATPTQSNVGLEGIMPYVSIPAGPVRLRITTAGTKTVLLDLNLDQLVAGEADSFLLVDSIGSVSPVTFLQIHDR